MVRSDSQYSALRGGPRRGSSGGGSGSRGSSGGSSSGRGASGGKRPPPGRGGRGRHDDDEDDFEDDDDDDGESYGLSTPSISGKRMSVTPHASFQNVVAGFYNGLPEKVRELLPWGEEEGESGAEDGPPPDRRGSSSWQEVSFIHSIPGEDEEEGLVVLADGSFRKYISCKGINALLFDEAEREMMARTFANFANSCESDIQIIIKSRNLSVDEYLSRYQILLKTDNDYLKWYADYTDKWFRKVQDVTFVPQRDFYVVISYHPPDCKTGKSWNGRRSIQKHEEYLEILNRLKKTAFEQLRASNLRPQVLTRKDVRNLIYSEIGRAHV